MLANAEPTVLEFEVLEEYTNATFASALCLQLNSTIQTLILKSSSLAFYVVPDCMALKAPTLASFSSIPPCIVSNFSVFPSTITTLSWNTLYATPALSSRGTVDGFTDQGSVSWNEVYTLLPNLQSLTIQKSNLVGSLPDQLPASTVSFSLQNTPLSGTIPPGLFFRLPSHNILSFTVRNCMISGSIPPSLFTNWTGVTGSNTITFDVSSNRLVGGFPASILASFNGVNFSTFTWNIHGNGISGPLPSPLLPDGLIKPNGVLTFNISSNQFSGTLPAVNYTVVPPTFLIDASNNLLSGTLPPRLFSASSGWQQFSATLSSFRLSLTNNLLSGTIPSTFLAGGMTANATFRTVYLSLGGNRLSGTIPEELFYLPATNKRQDGAETQNPRLETGMDESSKSVFSASSASTSDSSATAARFAYTASVGIQVDLSSNQLLGTLPAGLLTNLIPVPLITTDPFFNISLDKNINLVGTISESILASTVDGLTRFHISASGTSLSGTLPTRFCTKLSTTYLNLAGTKISGDFPSAWLTGCKFSVLNLSNCSSFNASLPSGFFSSNKIASFSAANTPLTGLMPAVTAGLSVLDLSGTSLDFCNASTASMSSSWQDGNQSCVLSHSPACNCPTNFTAWCTVQCAPPTPCSGNQPNADFECVNGVWTTASTNVPTLIIPSGVGAVVTVSGNLTSESIIIQGLGTSVAIGGCAANLSSVVIEINPSELESLGTQLHILVTTDGEGTCASSLDDVNLSISVKSGGCKKVKAQKVVSDNGSTLGAYFTLNKSSCNTWWIILVSVICGLILVAVIAVVLLAVLYKPFRETIRPFSKDRRAEKALEGKAWS